MIFIIFWHVFSVFNIFDILAEGKNGGRGGGRDFLLPDHPGDGSNPKRKNGGLFDPPDHFFHPLREGWCPPWTLSGVPHWHVRYFYHQEPILQLRFYVKEFCPASVLPLAMKEHPGGDRGMVLPDGMSFQTDPDTPPNIDCKSRDRTVKKSWSKLELQKSIYTLTGALYSIFQN